jgi:LacI family transcriptional regulator
MAEATRLGYYPDPAARRLITGRSGNIGLIVPDLANPFFADAAKGVERAARQRHMGLFISDTDEQDRLEPEAVRRICRQVDGLIWASPRSAGDVLKEVTDGVPTVLLHRRIPGWWSVSADIGDGMAQALRNLYSLGHRRIAYAGGPERSYSGQLRLEGLLGASAELDLDIIRLGSFAPTADGGILVADLVLATGATALVAYNDTMALGAISRAVERGRRVPEDLSVIACDDIAYARMTIPPLTTIQVPRHEAGSEAVALLDELMADPQATPKEKILPTQLVIRRTTDVPRV